MQYAITVALHHQEIGKDPQRLSKIKPFINNYNSGISDWKKFERNNEDIALNILSASPNTKKNKSHAQITI